MKKFFRPPLPVLSVILLALLMAACGGEEVAEETAEEAQAPPPSEVSAETGSGSLPSPDVPPLRLAEAGPVRPGCGDYRLLVTIETDALGAAAHVVGPEGEVDVVWTLSGPGMALTDPPEMPGVFNDDNRDLFGIEGNEGNDPVTASFVLLISGVQPGQLLELEMGHEAPGPAGTQITIANAREGLSEETAVVLGSFQMSEEPQTVTLDICSAEPMPLPEPPPPLVPRRLLAFFYPWWGTETCAGDASGWVGPGFFVTPHTPISRDGERVIYQQTDCWMEVTDENGRTGQIYDVTDTAFLAEQMRLAQAAGLNGFAVSVHGDNEYEMNYLAEYALPTAAQVNFLVAALYEAPEGGWSYDDATDVAVVGEHLRRVVEIAAESPAYLTVSDEDGRVVIFVDPSIPARFPSAEAWAAVRAQIDEAGVPYALISGPGAFTQVFSTGFEGVYNDLEVLETGEIALGEPPYSFRDERRLAYRATAWSANEAGMWYALPVVPGWEAEIIRPGDGTIPRDYGMPGSDGEYYRVRWEDALENYPHWIVITSWNEWAEGTEIEPSQQYPPSRFDYLSATAHYACLWRGDLDCQ